MSIIISLLCLLRTKIHLKKCMITDSSVTCEDDKTGDWKFMFYLRKPVARGNFLSLCSFPMRDMKCLSDKTINQGPDPICGV
jgi:hypothetical protein